MGDLMMQTIDALKMPRQTPAPDAEGQARVSHILDQRIFRSALVRERKRADRSNRPLILLLARLEGRRASSPDGARATVTALMAIAGASHVTGWFESGR